MTVLDAVSLHKFLVHFTNTLTPELADQFANLPNDPSFQQRLDTLSAKANEGLPTREEASEYDTDIEAMDVVALLRVKTAIRQKSR